MVDEYIPYEKIEDRFYPRKNNGINLMLRGWRVVAKYIVFVMVIVSIVALFLVIKYPNKKNNMGQVLYKTPLGKGQKLIISIAVIVILFMSVLAIFQVKEDFSGIGGVIYWLTYMLPLIAFNQVFIIRENGIGKQSIISNGKYGLIEWNKVKGYRWNHDKLIIMYIGSNKLTTMEFKVKIDDKSTIEHMINKKIE